jgi:hypothetical protein
MVAAHPTSPSSPDLITLHTETDTAFVRRYLLTLSDATTPIHVCSSPICCARLA